MGFKSVTFYMLKLGESCFYQLLLVPSWISLHEAQKHQVVVTCYRGPK